MLDLRRRIRRGQTGVTEVICDMHHNHERVIEIETNMMLKETPTGPFQSYGGESQAKPIQSNPSNRTSTIMEASST